MRLSVQVVGMVCLLVCETLFAQREKVVDDECSNGYDRYECVVDALWLETTQWLKAWAEHDVETYLSFYAKDKSPIEGLSYKVWRQQRSERVGRDKPLKLGVNFLDAEMVPGRKVRLLFIQRYNTDTYSDIVLKTLVYQLIDDEFRIIQEVVHQTLTEQDAQTIIDNIK